MNFNEVNHTLKVLKLINFARMFLVFRYILAKDVTAMALWPFIILRKKELKKDIVLLNHERIHLRQQLELALIFFYIWYIVEFVMRWVYYGNYYKAYRNISFEKEAYGNDQNLVYLKKRKIWSFLRYL